MSMTAVYIKIKIKLLSQALPLHNQRVVIDITNVSLQLWHPTNNKKRALYEMQQS